MLRHLMPGHPGPGALYGIIILLIGYGADLLLGDPRNWPHPVRWYGTAIAQGTRWLNRGRFRVWKGAGLTLLLCSAVFLFFYAIQRWLAPASGPGFTNSWPGISAYILFSSLFVFFALANKSLLQEGREVFDTLEKGGLEAGRQRLSWIVGRDTTHLSAQQVRIAVLESMSENLSDGVIAPLFFYLIGGLPAMMTYKMINTLDSMIGYKNETYGLFGRFAARLDDVANFIPARLTAFLMILVTGSRRGAKFVLKYGRAHASPNAGYPEAALAGILDCRFGGTNRYKGIEVVKPFIGERDRPIAHREFTRVQKINQCVTLVMVLLTAVTLYFLSCPA